MAFHFGSLKPSKYPEPRFPGSAGPPSANIIAIAMASVAASGACNGLGETIAHLQ